MSNFLKALGQGLRIAGASQSPENFAIYNEQNQFRAKQEAHGKEIALGLIVKAMENGSVDPDTGREAIRRLQIPGLGNNIPQVGLSIERERLNEEKRQFDIGVEQEEKRREAVSDIVNTLRSGQKSNSLQSATQQTLAQQAPSGMIQMPSETGGMFKPEGSGPVIAPIGKIPAQNDEMPPQMAGLETKYGSAASNPVVQQTATDLQKRIPGIDPQRAYEASIAIAQLGDEKTATRVKDYAAFLQSSEKDRLAWERDRVDIDNYGIGKDKDRDQEFVIESDGKGGFKKRWLTSKEANDIRNTSRRAAAQNISVSADYSESRDDKRGELYAQRESAALNLDSYAAKVRAIVTLAEDYPGGIGTEIQSQIGRLFPESEYGKVRSVDEAIASIRVKMATQVREQGSGQTSNYEMEMYLSAIPGLINNRAGREMMAQMAERVAAREARALEIFEDMLYDPNNKTGRVRITEYRRRVREELGPLLSPEEMRIMKKAAFEGKNFRYSPSDGPDLKIEKADD